MKSGKRKLIFSTSCLIAAFALAVFTVYAWFVQFENVATGGIYSKITSADVISFEIDFYKTTLKDGAYTVEGKIDKSKTDSLKWMPEYEPSFGVGSSKTTAVLADMKLRVSKTGPYTLKATTHSPVYVVEHSANPLDDLRRFEENYLSNVISMWRVKEVQLKTVETNEEIKQVPDKFSETDIAEEYNFITAKDAGGKTFRNYFDGENDAYKKSNQVVLYPCEVDEDETGHYYYLIDYMPEQISALYAIMLQNFPAASLSEEIKFNQDIIFEIGKK